MIFRTLTLSESIDDLQTSIDRLILVFYVFFMACIVSLVLTIFTLVFNRTALKGVKFTCYCYYVDYYFWFFIPY